MTPVLKNGGKRIREYAYHAYNKRTHLGRALRDERYRIVEWTSHENGKIVYELYDYEKDYLETVNIAAIDLNALNYMKALLAKEPPAKAQVRRRGR
jgi:iduronate 2-sulfatase